MSNKFTFWYLATPYTLYPHGMENAYAMACEQAGRFVRAGIPVFSPIAHTHGIAEFGSVHPTDHAIWLPADKPFVDAASGLVMVLADGWKESKGMAWELAEFEKAGKPIVWMCPGHLPISVFPHA